MIHYKAKYSRGRQLLLHVMFLPEILKLASKMIQVNL